MKLIQVSAYYPPHLGGQENAVHELSRQLANNGHAVHVLTSAAGGGKTGIRHEAGVWVRRMRGLIFGHAPIMPWFPFALFKVAKNSLVHLHIGQAFTPEMVWLISKLRHFKYIAQLHIDFEPSGPAGFLLPLYKRFILKRVLQSASAVITLNQKTYDTVRSNYGYTGNLQIMSNGIGEAYFTLNRPPFAKQPPKTLRLLFVGRLSKQKNVPALLRALKITKRNVQLHIIGDGDQLNAVKKIINDHKLTNVTLHGRLDRQAVMKFYKTCDALIMPSLYEAQPLVLLEAMAARIPIIGTSVIGVQDHIDGAGIIVEPTAQGLAGGIEQYYTNYQTLPQMVEDAYFRAEELRWHNTLQKYENLYETVLES